MVQWKEKSNVRACNGGDGKDAEEYSDKEWLGGVMECRGEE